MPSKLRRNLTPVHFARLQPNKFPLPQKPQHPDLTSRPTPGPTKPSPPIKPRPGPIQPPKPPTAPPKPVTTPGTNLTFTPVVTQILPHKIPTLSPFRRRNQLTVPVSTDPDPEGKQLFEDPADPQKTYYLPRYELDMKQVGDEARYELSLEKSGERWRLDIRLIKTEPDIQGVKSAEEISHEPAMVLRFRTNNEMQRELSPDEFVPEGDAIRATYWMDSISKRDAFYHALTKIEFQTQLVVRRTARVAVPVKKDNQGQQLYQVKQLPFEYNPEPRPFVIDPELHDYAFADVTNVAERELSFERHSVSWKGHGHSYFQDPVESSVFLYLPDHFKITREMEPPFKPSIRVAFGSEDDSLENMKASIEYMAMPVYDMDRLEAAARSLRDHIDSEDDELKLEPLAAGADQIRFLLTLPGNAGGRREFVDVVTDIRREFSQLIPDLNLETFQTIFDAMFGGSTVLFTGDILVQVQENVTERIPFSARMDDLAGEVFEMSEQPEGLTAVSVSLRNGIESPVELPELPVELSVGEQLFKARPGRFTRNGSPAELPVTLNPGEELQFLVFADEPVDTEGTPDAMFDLDPVIVHPDREALWNVILDDTVSAEYSRRIRVIGFEELFTPHTDVKMIIIDFPRGDSALIRPGQLEDETSIQIPIRDYILGGIEQGEYRYTMRVIRSSGQQSSEHTATSDILVPDLS